MPKSADPRARTVITLPIAPARAVSKGSFILVLSGTRFGELYKLPERRAVRIGRGEGVDIRLDDEGISRVHCSLEARGPQTVLRDLGSQNGTYVGGERVRERMLVDGDRVQIGADTAFKIAYADEVEMAYQRRLAEIALRDPLTGAYNRRHFGERLAAEFAAARRYQHALSLVLTDVDHLARVNEAHGRRAGDEVLRGVANEMQALVRGADVVARVGGDEFAILLRETELQGARTLAERLRSRIEEMWTRVDGRAIGVTATIAIAVVGPDRARELEQPGELMDRAEQVLDRLKELGTNRVGN